MLVNNVEIYGLEESIKASKYPMSINVEGCNSEITKTVLTLGNAAKGSGHDQFLSGIIVQFDLTFSLKAWTEIQRYNFVQFVSSQSTMHRIAKFNLHGQCNEYVDPALLNITQSLVLKYNNDPTPENYLKLLYNIPTGFQLTARLTTNYRALKTIYAQRKTHRLPEWRELCQWIETLPKFEELCLGGDGNG